MNVSGNIFADNHGVVCGGGVYWYYVEPGNLLTENHYSNNRAWFGPNYVGPISSIQASYAGEGWFEEKSGSSLE